LLNKRNGEASRSIFREQVFQIRRGEAAGETLLAQHVSNRLRLHRRVLPRIVQHHVTGVGEIQTGSRRAQTQQKYAGLRVGLERADDLLPVPGIEPDIDGSKVFAAVWCRR
jgi:hypothetical protein